MVSESSNLSIMIAYGLLAVCRQCQMRWVGLLYESYGENDEKNVNDRLAVP